MRLTQRLKREGGKSEFSATETKETVQQCAKDTSESRGVAQITHQLAQHA